MMQPHVSSGHWARKRPQNKELYFKEKKGQYLMFDIQSGLTCNDA